MLVKKFEVTNSFKKFTYIFLGIGALALILGIFILAMSHDEHSKARFWSVLLQNSVFFLMVANAAMFFICVTTLAHGAWQIGFIRIPEAISKLVPILGVISLFVFIGIIYGHHHHIYHWLDKEAVAKDPILTWKKAFLNPTFFFVWTIITLSVWSFVGYKMRQLSAQCDGAQMSKEESKKFVQKNTIWSAIFVVFFGLTTASTIPWLWLMSIDAHWFSTMYSWYTFITTFVSAIALITLFTLYLKKNNFLPFVTDEHFHDLGKFLFAFSIFWTYLWFSQFMLIWYANIPEETGYFKVRFQGPYQTLFFLNLIVNFITPFLVFMTRDAKRNYRALTIMSIIIILGHWLDFYQMVTPGILGSHFSISWFEIGILILFVGLVMFFMQRYLKQRPLLPVNNPYVKESLIYHT